MKYVSLIENMISWQGEGCDIGRRVIILRFKFCDRVELDDIKPCYYCDTLVKMRVSNEATYAFEEIQNSIDEQKCGLLITGGEPTFGLNYFSTRDMIHDLNYPFANIETNGFKLETLMNELPSDKNIRVIYSPKFFSEHGLNREMNRVNSLTFNESLVIKVVVEDNPLMFRFLEFLDNKELNQYVYLMPEGKTPNELYKNSPIVFDVAEKYKMNFSSRDHIIYGFI